MLPHQSMFPIRDDNPHFLTPVVTYAIIAANVFAWYAVQGLGTEPALVKSLCTLGMIPVEFLGNVAPGTVVPLGDTACVLGGTPTWHTPFTSMFLHGGWLHLIGNMWFMWIFGNNVEDSMGHVRFAVFYMLSGLIASAIQIVSNPTSYVPMIGASGAIGGVMGAYIVLYPRVRVHMLLFFGFFFTRVVVPASFMLGYWFLIQLLGGYTDIGRTGGGTAFWAHVGGFAGGAVLVLYFRKPELVRRHPHYGWRRSQR
jgi:membrane associated rhomboid family serine protease